VTLTQRGTFYHIDTTIGGQRVRCSLGVSDPKAAERLSNRVAFALADGPKSEVWETLKVALPASSFKKLTVGMGLPERTPVVDFEKRFFASLDRRTTLGELALSTLRFYNGIAEKFFAYLHRQGVRKMDEITKTIIEDYLVQRTKGFSRSSLIMEIQVLRIIFKLAVEEEVIKVSPIKDFRKIKEDDPDPDPFTAEEISRLDGIEKNPQDDLVYKLFRHTGMRRSDVADLRWTAIDWDAKLLKWRTKKRGKQIIVPLVPDLYKSLKDGYLPDQDTVLGMGPSKVYQIIKRIGRDAGVENVHPHRFRHSLSTELLAKGATLYDVARILGDNPETVSRYYAGYADKQTERIRDIMVA
jgi:integrase/recombinase XerD